MPIQRPTPLIIGGDSDPAMERAATRGAGWFLTHTAAECVDRTSRFWKRVDKLGRRRDGMSIMGTIHKAQ
jgi:alkanesulfonate monooxygenase SsuD/methylene tetrahydromethanopterin reductase-like flavin-dependent oxidoreductase (luciferase family)